MAPGGNKADIQNARAKLVESYNQILGEFTTGAELKHVGNYAVSRMIGKGSFGKVYLARHKLTGIKVVLKSAEKTDLNLAREIHHYRQLLHPHIARLYEVIITETLVWLVLEYCPGDELYAYLIRKGRLSADQTQRIFAQLCGAVAYIHKKNIVHRDLKLENILMDQYGSVKLCDFGFTRECEPKRLLQTFCGTICYAAPEMVQGQKYHGQAVDVWSLGVILYALLCGELPFDDEDEMQTRAHISDTEPVYPDHLPEDALALVRSMLSKKAINRPSAFEILQHPFLAPYSSSQLTILELPDPVPFSTKAERDLLDRLRQVYVDVDAVRESVVHQKCDNLAGWWSLALEREQRNSKRMKKKRRSDKTKRLPDGALARHSDVAIPFQKPVKSETDVQYGVLPESTDDGDSTLVVNPKDEHRRLSRKQFGSLADAFATVRQWASHSKKRESFPLNLSSKRSSIKSFFSLGPSTSNGKTLNVETGSAQAHSSPPMTAAVGAKTEPTGKREPNRIDAVRTGALKRDNGGDEDELRKDVQTNLGSTDAVAPHRVKLAVPNPSRGIYGSDSRSNSRDRHSSPGSLYVPRIGRTSTSSSFSSLRSTTRRKSTLSRASSTSSNSVSSMSRSPRLDVSDRRKKSWRAGDLKFKRHRSYDDDSSVSLSSVMDGKQGKQPSTPTASFFDASSSMGVRMTRSGRNRAMFNGEAVFFGSRKAESGYGQIKGKQLAGRASRGRRGMPATAGEPVDSEKSKRRNKSAEGVEIKPATVDEEDEYSEEETMHSRRNSLA